MNKEKLLGQTFTPNWVVNLMLDKIEYNNASILNKVILEPSCGDGAFLIEIVKRFIKIAREQNKTNLEIKNLLEKNILGIEIDKDLQMQSIKNIDYVAEVENIFNIKWNIVCDNFLIFKREREIDFIIGNPPYVRIHNLDLKTRELVKQKYQFCKNGTTDLYIAFYEEALKSVAKNGIVSFITPNSFLRNASAKNFRNYISDNSLLFEFIDFGEKQIFDKVSTYTAICLLKQNSIKTKYYKNINDKIEFVKDVELKYFKNKDWCFDVEIKNYAELFKNKKFIFDIKYGFATLRDKIYISDINDDTSEIIYFNGFKVEKSATIPVIKASLTNYKKQRIIYPYKKINDQITLIEESEIKILYPLMYEYLLYNKEELLKRDMDDNCKTWYQYGRSQGIQSILQEKLIISGVAKDAVNVNFCDSNTAIYSGMFLTSSKLQEIYQILKSKKFLEYIKAVGKDIQGGYKTFNTRQIRDFLVIN